MENGDIVDNQVNQSTGDYKAGSAPSQARLNNPTGDTWVPVSESVAKLVVDLRVGHRILGIDAHGNNKNPSNPGYPTNFKIDYYSASSSWQTALSVSITYPGMGPVFSKVPKSFRTPKAIAKSQIL